MDLQNGGMGKMSDETETTAEEFLAMFAEGEPVEIAKESPALMGDDFVQLKSSTSNPTVVVSEQTTVSAWQQAVPAMAGR